MGESKYAALCEVSTHPVPDLRPQQFNHAGRSMTGGIAFQRAGFLVVLNELAIATTFLVVFAATACKVPVEQVKEIREACAACLRSVGSIGLENVQEALKRPGAT
jgi:hypothetical protein